MLFCNKKSVIFLSKIEETLVGNDKSLSFIPNLFLILLTNPPKDFLNSDTNKEIHLCIHKSKHPEDSDLINFKDNKLISVIKKPHSEKSGYSSCCLFLTDKRILKYDGKDFMKDILEQADTSVYLTDSEMLDLGTAERLKYANDKNTI